MSLLHRVVTHSDERRQNDAYNAVVRYEAKIGGQLFGPIPKGHRREFFCLDKHTWVWYEEWIDANGRREAVTTHYHVRPDGILKTQGAQVYKQVGYDELKNFYVATKLYGEVIPPALERLLNTA